MSSNKKNKSFIKSFSMLSPAKQLLVFLITFTIIGGGIYVYRSFALTEKIIDYSEDSNAELADGGMHPMTSQDVIEVEENIRQEREAENVAQRAGDGDGEGMGGLRDEIIKTAKSQKGSKDWKKYVNGGTCGGTKNKWCTAFVSWVYNQNYTNYKIKDPGPCDSGAYANAGASRKIDKKLKRGDTLFWRKNGQGHTAIYMNKNNGGKICSIDGNYSGKVDDHCEKADYWDGYYPLTAHDPEEK